jgi:hypothetical protein
MVRQDFKDYNYGDKIEFVYQICNLASYKRCCIVQMGSCKFRIPAAFLQNMQAMRLVRLIDEGIWVYKKNLNKEELEEYNRLKRFLK